MTKITILDDAFIINNKQYSWKDVVEYRFIIDLGPFEQMLSPVMRAGLPRASIILASGKVLCISGQIEILGVETNVFSDELDKYEKLRSCFVTKATNSTECFLHKREVVLLTAITVFEVFGFAVTTAFNLSNDWIFLFALLGVLFSYVYIYYTKTVQKGLLD